MLIQPFPFSRVAVLISIVFLIRILPVSWRPKAFSGDSETVKKYRFSSQQPYSCLFMSSLSQEPIRSQAFFEVYARVDDDMSGYKLKSQGLPRQDRKNSK